MAEPKNLHEPWCPIWTSDDPAITCRCRGADGKTRRDPPDPITTRQQLEDEWRGLTLAERCHRLDHIAAL